MNLALPDGTKMINIATLLGGLPMSKPDDKTECQPVAILPGQSEKPPQFPGWTFSHLEKTAKPFLATCAPSYAKKIRESLAIGKHVPSAEVNTANPEINTAGARPKRDCGLLTYILKTGFLPRFPRYRFDTQEAMVEFVAALHPQKLSTHSGSQELAPDLSALAVAFINYLMTLPNWREIDVFRAIKKESELLMKKRVTCRELIFKYARKKFGRAFDPNDPRKEKQFPWGSVQRPHAKILFYFERFAGDKFVDEISDKVARECVADYDDIHEVSIATLVNDIWRIHSFFNFVEKETDHENPFTDIMDELKVELKAADKKDPRNKPVAYPIKMMQALLKAAWETDKLLCRWLVLVMFAGIRTCEMFKARGNLVALKAGFIDVWDTVAKPGTGERHIPIIAVLRAWLLLFPDFDPAEKLVPFSKAMFVYRCVRLRTLVNFPSWGRAGLRKVYALYLKAKSMPREVMSENMGNNQNNSAIRLTYTDGEVTREWGDDVDKRLMPKVVLGYLPKRCTLEELHCTPSKSEIMKKVWITRKKNDAETLKATKKA